MLLNISLHAQDFCSPSEREWKWIKGPSPADLLQESGDESTLCL